MMRCDESTGSGDSQEKIHSRHLTGVSSSIYLNSVDQGWNGNYAAAFGNLINIINSNTGNAVIILSGIHKVTVRVFHPIFQKKFLIKIIIFGRKF